MFLPPKNPEIEKFQTPKNPSLIPVTWKPESPSPPWELVQDLLKGYDNLIGLATNSAGPSTLFQN